MSMSQTQISKALKVDQSTVSRIARGINAPSPELAERLEALFPGTTPWEWIKNPKSTWLKVNSTTGAGKGIKDETGGM